MARTSLRAIHAALVLAGCAGTAVQAQTCAPRWVYGPDHLGGSMLGSVLTGLMWDPDGAGPEESVFVIGGTMTSIGGQTVGSVAAWDSGARRWIDLGGGFADGSTVRRLHVTPHGELLAAGTMILRGAPQGTLATVAKWTGQEWGALGDPVSMPRGGPVLAMMNDPSGGLIVAGSFNSISGQPVPPLARWDGTMWSPLASGIGITSVNPIGLAPAPEGGLVVLGASRYAVAPPPFVSGIARLQNNVWSSMAGAQASSRAVVTLPGGDLVAEVSLPTSLPSTRSIARWDGTAWTTLGPALTSGSNITSLTLARNGDIIAAGRLPFINSGQTLSIARWDGSRWNAMPSPQSVDAIYGVGEAEDGRLFIAGSLSTSTLVPGTSMLEWKGSAWLPLATAINGPASAVAPLPGGGAIIAGSFNAVGQQPALRLVIWDGSQFTPVGPGASGLIRRIVRLADDDYLFFGDFTSIGGVSANRIARWNRQSFTAPGEGLNGLARAVAVAPSGELYVGGSFTQAGGQPVRGLARWDGTTWSDVGFGVEGLVSALAIHPSGDLYVGGQFLTFGPGPTPIVAGNIARWDGSQWHQLGFGGYDTVTAIRVMQNGDVVASGDYDGPAPGQRIVGAGRWNGQFWSQFGSGRPARFIDAPGAASSNEFLASGGFFGRATALARWDGTQWQPFGPPDLASHDDLALLERGEIMFVGSFNAMGGQPSVSFARWNQTSSPWIARSPRDIAGTPGQTLTFTASPASGYGNLTATWEIESAPGSGAYVALGAGPSPVSVPGSAALATITPPSGPLDITTLLLSSADAGLHLRRVRVTIASTCGSATSAAARIAVGPACYANCDNSQAEPVLNALDFNCFLLQYRQAASLPPAQQIVSLANCDGSTTIPALNAADFVCFLERYRQGCQ